MKQPTSEQSREATEEKDGGEVALSKPINGNMLDISTSKTKSSFRSLIEACKRKDLDQLSAILDSKPEIVQLHDKYGRNALHYLAMLVSENQNDLRRQQERCLNCFKYLEPKLLQPAHARSLWNRADSDGLTILHFAVISCNTALVRHLLLLSDANKSAASIEQSLLGALDGERHSALHWAVIINDLECVKLLVQRSNLSLVHTRDQNGATPLHYATQTSNYPKFRAQLRKMLKNASHDSDPQTQEAARPMGKQISLSESDAARRADQDMQRAERTRRQASEESLEVLAYLVSFEGVNLECVDNDQRTPLLWAASSGNHEAILLLARTGANLLACDANSLSALHCAASHGFTECLDSLLKLQARANLAEKSSRGEAGRWQLVNKADSLSCTPLFYAILSGNIDCIELLLDRGAQVDWQDMKGRTAAHFAALKGQLNSLKLLESRGANLWLANKQGDLPLHYAIKSSRQPVISWLLERSPYERAVNAINNYGRAPIHLAVIRDNRRLLEWLIERYGANMAQLVRVREKTSLESEPGSSGAPAPSQFRYETALDMARRLTRRDCAELLERLSAPSARQVMLSRGQTTEPVSSSLGMTTNLNTLGSSCSTSAELQASELPPAVTPAGLLMTGGAGHPLGSVPRLPAGPAAISSQVPMTSDSSAPSGSSSLSQSSMNSVRGVRLPNLIGGGQVGTSAKEQQTRACRPANTASGPYEGGISYHNNHINASIKCKLYGAGEQGQQKQHSFPPLSSKAPARNRCSHSTGSLERVAVAATKASSNKGSQEIITNVNVYTSPCAYCVPHNSNNSNRGMKEQQARQSLAGRKVAAQASESDSDATTSGASVLVGAARRATRANEEYDYEEEKDDDDDDDEMDLDENEQAGLGGQPRSNGCDKLPQIATSSDRAPRARVELERQERALANQSTLARQGRSSSLLNHTDYSSQLPVIMSAEEERSTSGDTVDCCTQAMNGVNACEAGQAQVSEEKKAAAMAEADFEARTSEFGFEHMRSPPLVMARPQPRTSSVERSQREQINRTNQQQHTASRPNYNHVKARVDSHRNDSGLSSAFGYAPNGSELDSPIGRRFIERGPSPIGSANRDSSYSPVTRSAATVVDAAKLRMPANGQHQVRARQRQIIIKTRRLSVDSVELAAQVEKSIRKYRQETKLFEELQNLKRSQIRSGRANEALLVKRLIERFKHETYGCLASLEPYSGPYTYKAYELYLYDQLRRLSQSNQAKLGQNVLADEGETLEVGARQERNYASGLGPMDSAHKLSTAEQADREADLEARDYLEEDRRAELELQRVINQSEQAAAGTVEDCLVKTVVKIEPSGALEEIRVRQATEIAEEVQNGQEAPKSEEASVQRQLVHQSQESTEQTQAEETELSLAPREEIKQGQAEERASGKNSVASSRRSSLDIEREKLKKLPLKVASELEDELKLAFEDQAGSLSSSIITDALGNVSRLGSPVGKFDNKSKQAADTNAIEDNSDAQSSCETLSNTSFEAVALQAASSRRKSVVNIGNKMQVIYHDVGIEIEPVVDDGHESGSGTPVDCSAELSMEKQERPSDAPASGPQHEPQVEVLDAAGHEDELDTSDASISKESENLSKETEKIETEKQMEVMKQASPISLRRASSPEGSRRREAIKQHKVNRNSVAGETLPTTGRCNEFGRKVFTGYDLDSYHSRKRLGNSDTSPPNADKPQEDLEPRTHSPAYKRHLPRSRLPSRPLRIRVPMDEIKARWDKVKHEGRLLKGGQRAGANVSFFQKSHITKARSQSNLGNVPTLINADEQNFVLIYEINKEVDEKNRKNREQAAPSSNKWLCQGKITRIVDIRSIRRTLSLPESIMYSNDLLKKFCILKL